MLSNKPLSVCVVGLGYVGLPLAYHMAYASVGNIIGYDINEDRIAQLRLGVDHTDMVPSNVLWEQHNLIRWSLELPVGCDVYIICVPTPDDRGIPDYSYVDAATAAVIDVAREDSVIVLESTVAPDTVRSRLTPLMQMNHGFDPTKTLLAFSPERVNPGPTSYDEMVRCTKIVAYDPAYKGSRLQMLVEDVYGKVFDNVSVFDDTRVAELAKCFENMQRDVNIALMNELSMICQSQGIEFDAVVKALRTKASSPVFMSGLVGGHCIPVDPYYLAAFYDDAIPERVQLPFIGRKINEEYIKYVALTAHKQAMSSGCSILVIGATYKPDVNDTRNSGALKIVEALRLMGHSVSILDPLTQVGRGLDDLTHGLVIGAVNHRTAPVAWHKLSLAIDCKFINIGGAFPNEDLDLFQTITQL